MPTFHTTVGKVRCTSNRRYFVATRRGLGHKTKDGQTAQVFKRTDNLDTARKALRQAAYGSNTAVVVDSTNGREVITA